MAEQDWRVRLIAIATNDDGGAMPVSVGLALGTDHPNTIAMQVDGGQMAWFQPGAAAEHMSNVRHIITEKLRIEGEL